MITFLNLILAAYKLRAVSPTCYFLVPIGPPPPERTDNVARLPLPPPPGRH